MEFKFKFKGDPFTGIKRPGREADHSTHRVDVKKSGYVYTPTQAFMS
jgi:hypothetical protein